MGRPSFPVANRILGSSEYAETKNEHMLNSPPVNHSLPIAKRRWKVAAACVLAVAVNAGWAQQLNDGSAAVTSVRNVDWQRYGGQWFELARLPNSFQRKCAGDVTAQYSAAAEGRLKVLNTCRRDDGSVESAMGEARKVNTEDGRLKVRFAPQWLAWVPFVWGDYWVLGLDDDYQTALVGTPDHEYLWLLSRTPQRSSAEIEPWLMRASAMGFDISRVMLTTQSAENPSGSLSVSSESRSGSAGGSNP